MREVLELSRSVVVACFLVFAAARGAEGSVAGDILSLTGGARTKVVWRRQSPPTVMIFDTNVGTEQVVTTAADGSQVFITPTGSRIVFMKNTTSLRVVDTNGANERELCAANSALGVAEDPPGTEWAYYADVAFNANPAGRLWRVQIDNTSVKEMMWDKTSICWQWAFTRDGRTAAAALPWPGCHIASLPNGSYYQVHDSGCQVAIAPSATRMLHCTALQFGGEHRGISVHVIPGGSDSEINLGDAPGVNNQTLLWPNWAMYDDRFFVISGPWTGDTGTTNILFAQFNTAFNGIANWVQVTQAPAGKQDCNPVCWIQSGSAPASVTIDTFTATPSTILPGGSSTLSWSTTNATSVSINQGIGTVAADGSRTVTPGATTTYTLTAQGEGGPVLSAVTIAVSAPANVAPTCSITSPSGGATYTAPATVSIAASASDTDGTIAKVEFYQGATKLGEDTSSSGGWTYSWTGVAAGAYSLTARAFDDDGASTTSAAVSITVNPPANVAPTCSITSPSGGATYTAPAMVSIAASASDTDGTIAKVEFYQGATKLGEDTSSAGGWTYSWTSVAAGGYSLTALAVDDDGASTTSAAVSITVNPPANVAPTCSITSPSGGATYTAPAMVSITASASDTDGTVARVEFYQGATKLGEDTSSAGGWTYTWNGAPTGSYSLTVVATDDDGATTTSASVSITVNDPPNQAPSVSITSPANNATYTALASVPIAADAADSDGTVAKVEFFNGGAKLGEDADANGGWTYTWSGVAAGSYSLTAVATDDDGAATTSTAINITVNDPSNTPPTVSITSPSDGSSYAAPASISIFADASDADGSVVLVEFFAGAAKIGEDANAAGGWTLDWSGVAAGSCVLTAKATDNEGGVAISAGVTVVVLRAPDNPSGTVSGIRYDYYEGDWSNLPNFDSLTAVKSGTVATFDISVRDTADYFGFEFAGYIDIPTDGAYTFYTTSDDGSRLFIGGGMIVDNDGLHGMVEVSGTVGLAEGLHEITVTHFERTGGEGLTVSWSGPGIAKQEIPGSVLEQIPSPNNAPTVSITSPANGASYVAPADINVMATAADSDGTIARVEMHLDGTFVSSLTTTPYEWADLTGLAVGTYSIRVTAYDDDGDSAQDTITVTVTAGGGPVDTDGDGLTDALEATLGTNPTEPDTDGDGIDDGDEVNVYGTDPTEADTDADGMDDDKEIANGFDPTDDDQDDNGTPDGQDDWDNDGIDNATEVAAGDPAGDAPHMQDTPAVSCVPGGAGSAAALAMVGLIGLLLRRRTSRRSCRRRDVAGDPR